MSYQVMLDNVMARYVKIYYEIIDKGRLVMTLLHALMFLMFSIVRTISSHLSSISGMNGILVWAVFTIFSWNACASFQSLSLS